jgi:hypothetical protein
MSENFNLKGSPGRIRDWMKAHRFPSGLVVLFMGLLSTLWFLIRVIPKPSRAYYPCMQVAAPMMSAFIIYLLSLGGITMALRKARRNLLSGRYLLMSLFLLCAIGGVVISITHGVQNSYAGSLPATGPDDGPNQPFGKAMGIYPGRVVWSWDKRATNENCLNSFESKDWYYKPENTNQEVVRNMFRNSLNHLTGMSSVSESWKLLFLYHNLNKYQKNAGYVKGEKIFIKVNQGTSKWLLNQEDKDNGFYYPETLKQNEEIRRISLGATETGPYIILELLRELINELGINPADIAVGDPMTDIYGHNYDVWFGEFPGVIYIGNYAANHGRTQSNPSTTDLLYYSDKTQSDKIYQIIEKADYLINVANLKPHYAAGISLTAKNHFGSQARTKAEHLHYSLIVPRGSIPSNGGYHKYRVLVDLMGSKYLGRNTVLYIVDGLFGGGGVETKPPVKYFMSPFNNDWCNSIFMSQDQVALESVCYDFLRTEWNGINKHSPNNNEPDSRPNVNGVDDYLHQAADSSNWPAGIIYDPDNSGKPLSSLGVHEHWNNASDKQYSRNLGYKNGIELVSIPDSLVRSKISLK